ncbi:hypothetical protein D9619_012049 [Psilocybe cf. subviscida]|uniref:beta-glucosidase n=1 Tax=Psilocybe cf. subviscida TaxID=2480587 RepID=A0A8H5EZH2_9AGAR|nr:hypothetical protein D9619_012049 [Psilocybe cf. subviscida]
MAPSDFAKANIDDVVEQLTSEEAYLLTAGVGFWRTHAIPRLGVPAIKVSDGPNGLRGNHFFMGIPAKCLPSSTALGATFDPELVKHAAGVLLGEEAKLRAASVILAPTVNIQRNPLGGRSFESFSEDPFLSGTMAAGYINGVQAEGIGATIKHFVANDKENDRMAYDSIMSPRALREVYLMPFMIAQRDAQPWAVMTAYNRVNGAHASENKFLLQDVLRKEWKYDGLIMSDWFGVYSLDLAVNAGLDLEMPGTNKWRTIDLMSRSVLSRKITMRTVKERARRVLELVQKCAEGAPEILDGDGVERTKDSDESTELMRKLGRESIVLLKNSTGVLPLDAGALKGKKVAIVGANAKALVLSGGGSAALKASFFVSPFQGVVNALKDSGAEVVYSEGARAYKLMPSLDYEIFTPSGERGWIASWYSHVDETGFEIQPEPLKEHLVDETNIIVSDEAPENITKRWTMKLKGQLRPREKDCEFEFGVFVAGRARLYVDGNLVIDNWTRQRRGEEFFGSATKEELGRYPLKAGVAHEIYLEFCNVRGPADGDEDEKLMDTFCGVRLGGAEVFDSDELLEEAVQLAKDADVTIAFVGLNAEWETEGYDRKTLDLPGRTNELVERVTEANPNTVVVTQSGSAITMPWKEKVSSIVHAWYLGNASGDAIADVLFGKYNPSGKLSLTFPKREEDLPSFGHFHSEDGKVRYSEDLYVGYKHYQHRNIEPLWAFGHGLSYTTFSLADLTLSQPKVSEGSFSLTASVIVTNTGSVTGSEVVQIYVSLPTTSELSHPGFQLKGFAKVHNVAPGATETVEITLDKYAVSYWSELYDTWVVEKGVYCIAAGSASDSWD